MSFECGNGFPIHVRPLYGVHNPATDDFVAYPNTINEFDVVNREVGPDIKNDKCFGYCGSCDPRADSPRKPCQHLSFK